jgi:hypothetical protein
MTTARTNTPDRFNEDGSRTITTKRACNGCGTLLGDVTRGEMNAAIAGRPMPDVRRECPTCSPTAPEPACRPVTVLSGDQFCVGLDCDHELAPGADYCEEVRKEIVCGTHSTFVADGFDYEELTHAEPWPCKRTQPPAA